MMLLAGSINQSQQIMHSCDITILVPSASGKIKLQIGRHLGDPGAIMAQVLREVHYSR
jgi:hypothetical protein